MHMRTCMDAAIDGRTPVRHEVLLCVCLEARLTPHTPKNGIAGLARVRQASAALLEARRLSMNTAACTLSYAGVRP